MSTHIQAKSGSAGSQKIPAGYKISLAGFIISLALCLLALVDIRRGFLFTSVQGFGEYALHSPYYVLSIMHLFMLGIGIVGIFFSYKQLQNYEKKLQTQNLEKYVQGAALVIFVILVVDIFTYRGVPAARAAQSGQLGAGWLEAYGVTGWLQPVALAVSYIFTVWHATLLGILFAGLALTILPRYMASFFMRTGFGGSLFGATYALPQPFCSCCASVIAPSLIKQGASRNFSLAFVVGSPMLNISGLFLAAVFLPLPYALVRIIGGILLTIPVTYGITWLADRWDLVETQPKDNWFTRLTARLAGMYCRLFHLDEILEGRGANTPAEFLATYANVSLRLAALLVPTLFIWSIVSSVFLQLLPTGYGNNLISVVITAVAGTLLMISTWTEIPVALQMLNTGYPSLAATVLLVLPPVSLPCLMILGGTIGKFRIVGLLASAVILMGVIAGVLFL